MNSTVQIECPICCAILVRSGRSYACQARHNFDLSGDGYLSLLHGRIDHSQVGDDKAMVRARVHGHTLPAFSGLAKAIAAICPSPIIGGTVLDIGCGEGFFLSHVWHAAGCSFTGIGMDISKEAVAKAAKAHSGLFFVRADVVHGRLPFADASFGLVLSIFAPRPMDEIQRVLRRDGSWLIVTAKQDHLKELRQFLPLAAIGSGKMDELAGGAYAIEKSACFTDERPVAQPDLVSIVEMSPSVHRLRREFGEKWKERVPDELKVTFSFSLTLLRRAPA